MDEIPEDVRETAMDVLTMMDGCTCDICVGKIARVLMAERERAVAACEAQKAIFASDEYATPQPLGGLMERFACDQCIAAIRKGPTP